MAYPTVNFRHVQGAIGMQPINETSATQNHPLGLLVQGRDETYGDGEFVYLKGVASTAAGDLVCYNSSSGNTVRAVIGGTGSSGPCAVAMSANVASQYGWYQVSGAGPVNSATVLANTSMYLTSTAGQIDDAVSANNQVSGVVIKAASSGGFATCQISRPSVIGMGGSTGSNSGDLTLAAAGSSANANGATLAAQVLNLEPASASFPGIVTTGAQTFAGAKTFAGAATFSSTLTRAATDRAIAVYSTAAGQSISDNTTDAIINFGTSILDEATAVTTGASWKYTCPTAGFYIINAMVTWAAGTTTVDSALYVYKNGSLIHQMARFGADPEGNSGLCGTSQIISCAATDYLDVRMWQSSGGARTLFANAALNWVCIHKVA
jgi:hypothetical protein